MVQKSGEKTTWDGAKTRPVNNGRYIRLPYQQGEFAGFSFTINGVVFSLKLDDFWVKFFGSGFLLVSYWFPMVPYRFLYGSSIFPKSGKIPLFLLSPTKRKTGGRS